MKIFVGVDIGKKNHNSCFLKEDGAVISSLSFAKTRKGFDKFLHLIKELQKQNFDITVIVEATGHYFLNLYSFLRNNSIRNSLLLLNDFFQNSFISLKILTLKLLSLYWNLIAIEIEIPFIVDEIFFIEKQVEKIREEIERKAKGIREIELLKTIPGIETVSAASIVGEITSISRFSSVSKLRAYAGIDPSIRESGTSVRGKSTLSKRGSPYLRRILFYAANATRRFSPVFKDYYERKILQHPDKERYAIIATANKLLSVIFYILKHNVSFDPNYERKIKDLSH